MSFNRDAAAPHRAREATKQLRERGVKLPKLVGDALATLDRIEASRPPAADTGAIRDLFLAGNTDADALHAAALAELAQDLVRTGHGQAVQHAAFAVLDAIADAANEIHAALAKLAGQHIDRLTKAAAIDTALDALIRSGRAADAEVIATAEIDARELDALYRWRDRYLSPSNRRPVLDVTRWREPDFGGHAFIDGLRAGGTLWYPTAAEAAELAAELHQQREAEAAILAGAK